MCGIVGYVGYRDAASVCKDGLMHLEYRGYDSYGIASLSPKLSVFKSVGKISNAKNISSLKGTCAIGHTRWATHGVPSEINAHPLTDCGDKIAVVHNGIIENYAKLKAALIKRGHVFKSETDTEVIPHLIEEKYTGNLLDAVSKILPMLEGSYAILAVAEGENTIVAARKGSPLVLGVGDSEYIFASDAVPLIDYTKNVIYLEDGDIAEVKSDGYKIFNGKKIVKHPISKIEWDASVVRKSGFPHYMLKEIFEQPDVFSNTIQSVKENKEVVALIKKASSITVVACGTSANASMIFSYMMEAVCKIPTRVVVGSEYKYFPTPASSLVIGVSQSGETADTISALKISKDMGAKTIAVTNVLGSSITRTADVVLYTRAGPEVSVAATKSFTAQVAAFIEIVNLVSGKKLEPAVSDILRYLPDVVSADVSSAVELCKNASTLLYVGRGMFYPVAMEGALKMKEISYIHAEGYAAGELKHGPFALLCRETPVAALCLHGATYSVMMSNLKEIKARNAPLVAVGEAGDQDLEDLCDVFIPLPKVSEYAGIILSSVILQIMAYHCAVALGRDVDMPRNLAKSVTVE
ncbi:MAG: glutamine--fructose-6-phosphate transaminase (isomerizing) [Methanocorpusculum sp.]|nr:glutamine--fructose-6-phosphate transaminase (isomerizing) [Methanocorpusculum sp.]